VRPAPVGFGRIVPGLPVRVGGAYHRAAEVVDRYAAAGGPVRLRYPAAAADLPVPGTPVAEERTGEVVGIVVAGGETAGDRLAGGLMAPIDAVAGHWTGDLATGHRSVARARVTVVEFALALCAVPTMGSSSGRNEIIRQLRPEIGGMVSRHTEQRLDVLALVRTCLRYRDGLDELLSLLKVIEGDSEPMQTVLRMRPDVAGS
jgi:hypothetical protein